MTGRIYNDIIETVGRTPLVRLNRVTAGVPACINVMVDPTLMIRASYLG